MAITADTVYAGSYIQPNQQAIGFYHNVDSADNTITTIVDDAMSADYDTLCTIMASTAVHTTDLYDCAVYADGTLISVMKSVDSTKSMDVVIPAGKNLKCNLSNQTDTTDQNVQVYVLIRQLQGTPTAAGA
jgi:hypothetical protein|tara:strand:+ start:57 stop:449 length:393 start_codon:yes stop_codon:yes gene_type:complete